MQIDEQLIKQVDLAKLLDVTSGAISLAVKNGHKVKGYEVQPYAVLNESGRIEGFRKKLYKKIKEHRENPTESESGSNSKFDFKAMRKRAKGEGNGKPKAVVYEDNSVRFLDDDGAKEFGNSIMKSTGLMVVPKTIDSINNLEDHNRDALFATFITICFGAFGYMAGGENKSLMAVGAGSIGLGAYTWFKQNSRTSGEDRAMLGSNPSASSRTGIAEPDKSETGLSGSNIHKMSAISVPKAVNP